MAGDGSVDLGQPCPQWCRDDGHETRTELVCSRCEPWLEAGIGTRPGGEPAALAQSAQLVQAAAHRADRELQSHAATLQPPPSGCRPLAPTTNGLSDDPRQGIPNALVLRGKSSRATDDKACSREG